MRRQASDSGVVVVAHRGQVAGYPENTLAAFRRVVALGFGAIEIHLRATADGHIVILHDDTVDKTTSGSGAVEDMTLAEIRSLDAGSYVDPRFGAERVPMYSEVLQALRDTGVRLILDIKTSDKLDHERVVRETGQHDMVADVIVGPRTVADLCEFNQLNPALRTLGFVGGAEFEPPDLAAIEAFASAGTDMIRLWPSWIFEDRDGEYGAGRSPLVGRMHELGKPVWTTADVEYGDIDPEHPREDLTELIRLGVDGIITDVPELLRDLLTTLAQQP